MGLWRIEPHALSPAGLAAAITAGATGLTLMFVALVHGLLLIQGLVERG